MPTDQHFDVVWLMTKELRDELNACTFITQCAHRVDAAKRLVSAWNSVHSTILQLFNSLPLRRLFIA